MALLKSVKQRFFHITLLFVVMLLCVAPLAWLSIAHPQQAQNISQIISQNTALFACFRWLLLIAFYVFWPAAITYISTRYNWPADKTAFWQTQRVKLTIWLALVEVILCESMLLAAAHLIEGV